MRAVFDSGWQSPVQACRHDHCYHDSARLLCAGEEGPVEARAQEGQPAPPDPAAPNLISTSTAAETGGVDTDVMESPFVTGGDETMKQEGQKANDSAPCQSSSVFFFDPCRLESC